MWIPFSTILSKKNDFYFLCFKKWCCIVFLIFLFYVLSSRDNFYIGGGVQYQHLTSVFSICNIWIWHWRVSVWRAFGGNFHLRTSLMRGTGLSILAGLITELDDFTSPARPCATDITGPGLPLTTWPNLVVVFVPICDDRSDGALSPDPVPVVSAREPDHLVQHVPAQSNRLLVLRRPLRIFSRPKRWAHVPSVCPEEPQWGRGPAIKVAQTEIFVSTGGACAAKLCERVWAGAKDPATHPRRHRTRKHHHKRHHRSQVQPGK